MKVLAISGSLRRDSHNRRLLLAAGKLLPPDVELELWDGPEGGARPTTRTTTSSPRRRPSRGCALRDRRRRRAPVRDAGVQLVDPRPAQERARLGLASDRATSVLRNKPVAVVGASTGAFGAVWAQAELRKVLAATGARVVDVERRRRARPRALRRAGPFGGGEHSRAAGGDPRRAGRGNATEVARRGSLTGSRTA